MMDPHLLVEKDTPCAERTHEWDWITCPEPLLSLGAPPWQHLRNVANSIFRHSFRPLTLAGQSQYFPEKQTIFSQGESSDAVFYIQKGKVKLTVLSKSGKEATIGVLSEGDFFGEGCLAGQPSACAQRPQ